MKILLVHDYPAPIGGAEIRLLRLREQLRALGHDARLLSSTARPAGLNSEADYECFGTMSRFRTLLQTANPSAYLSLRRVLRAFKPDVVHVKMFLTQLSPLILPLLRDVPSLYHVVWYRPVCPRGTKLLPGGSICRDRAGAVCLRGGCLPLRDWVPLMLQMRLWRRWRSAFDLIVANSEAVRTRLLADGIQPVEVIQTGSPVRPPRPPLSDPPTAAFAGRLVYEKGADLLLEAFARLAPRAPNARLLVVGDGPERRSLERLAERHRLPASFLGHLSGADLERELAGAWVQVVPSRWEEPFGLVASEAMMRGTALIATGSGGLAEIVRHGESGTLVPPGDVAALADALLDILADRERAKRMGARGRELALAGLSDERDLGQFVSLYHRLVEQSGRRREA